MSPFREIADMATVSDKSLLFSAQQQLIAFLRECRYSDY